MKTLVLATVSVLALGLGIANAQTTAPTTSPNTIPSTSAATGQMSKSEIEEAQQELKKAGLYNGAIDGQMGPATKQAVQKFQQQKGLPSSGELDEQTLQALNGGSTAPAGSTPAPTTNAPITPPSR